MCTDAAIVTDEDSAAPDEAAAPGFLSRRFRPWAVLAALGWLGIAGTVLSFLGRWHWAADLTTHFRVQFGIGGLLLSGGLWWLRQRRLATLFGAVAALHLLLVAPLYFGAEKAPAGAARYRVLLANVNRRNTDASRLLELIAERDPDVVLLLEVTPRWLADVASLGPGYPYLVDVARADAFGMAVFSRVPFATPPILRYPGYEGLPTVCVCLDFGGRSMTLLGAHPPRPPHATSQRNITLRELAVIADRQAGPVMVLGDLNTSSFSPAFRQLTASGRLRDSRRGFGVQPTWPAQMPLLLTAIDHCLVSSDIAIVDRRVERNIGSDHYPITVDFAFRPVNPELGASP